MNIIEQFESIANIIKYEFTSYMWGNDLEWDPDAIKEYGQWLWNKVWTADFWEWSFFFDLTDMYQILKYQYAPKVVEAHYNYMLDYAWDDKEYGINLKTFSKVWWGQDIEQFAEVWHDKLDKQRAYWNSEAWQKETEEQMQELKDKYLTPYLKEYESKNPLM